MIGFLSNEPGCRFYPEHCVPAGACTGDTEFPVADIETNKLPDEFAAHQIKTTANFATRNKLISWLVGGLNFQIEHHLFPKISHVHYPAISEIVRSVCNEYQLQYIEYPTMRKAVVAHVRFLRHLGNTLTNRGFHRFLYD
jgi:linoleoyl-CoA desaturase